MEGLIIVAAIIFIIAKNVAKIKQQGETQFTEQPQEDSVFQQREESFSAKWGGRLERETLTYESTEGSESNEGKCIEPDANHCVVEHPLDTVYAEEIGSENNNFAREDFVKGIIMAEILSKPKSMQ